MSSRLEEAEHKVQSLQTGTSLLSLHSLGYCLNIPFKHNFRSLHKKCIYCLSFGGKHFSVNLFAHMICCLTAVHVSSVGRTRARSLIFQLTICSCCCVVHSTRLINNSFVLLKVLLLPGYYRKLRTDSFPSFAALETTQAELFDLKTKYDEESTAKYVTR